jgi:arabinose-5-phosphate isomerase
MTAAGPLRKFKSIEGGKRLSRLPVASALRTLDLECEGLSLLREALSTTMARAFEEALQAMRPARGRVIVTGIGKSGHVGQKIAATFASTGRPAFFVHPTEASHGDLGMITPDDVLLALSWSGETVELKPLITYSRRHKVPLIAITSRAESALGQHADIVLELPRIKEACPHGLAPTTSTTMQLALGDCLAIALLEARGFTANEFKDIHPGGSLGASLQHVADVMHKGDAIPLARDTELMGGALVTMTQKAFGCLGIVDAKGKLIGIADIMTRRPKTATPKMLASAALEMINAARITALFVVEKGKPVGIVHVHDLLRAGVA